MRSGKAVMNHFGGRFRANTGVNVLGVKIDPVDLDKAAQTVVAWLTEDTGRARYICATGVHGVMEAQRDGQFRAILNNAALNVPDGMPMVWLGRFAGFRSMGRVFGPTFMLEVCKRTAPLNVRHFFYGGMEGVAERLAEAMRTRYPGLRVAGSFCPPFRPLTENEVANIAERINRCQADIVWVGLSTPKQERWIAEIVPHLEPKLLFSVGAAFDFNLGAIKRAPVWMQQASLEWLYRLMQEPRRLYKRYLLNNPAFIALVLNQLIGFRAYQITDGRGVVEQQHAEAEYPAYEEGR